MRVKILRIINDNKRIAFLWGFSFKGNAKTINIMVDFFSEAKTKETVLTF